MISSIFEQRHLHLTHIRHVAVAVIAVAVVDVAVIITVTAVAVAATVAVAAGLTPIAANQRSVIHHEVQRPACVPLASSSDMQDNSQAERTACTESQRCFP